MCWFHAERDTSSTHRIAQWENLARGATDQTHSVQMVRIKTTHSGDAGNAQTHTVEKTDSHNTKKKDRHGRGGET